MKNQFLIFLIIQFVFNSCTQTKENILKASIDATLLKASSQYEYMMKNLPEGQYPKTYNATQDKLETSGSEWWCSGFYPGSLLYLNEEFNKPVFTKEIDKVLNDLKREQYNKTTHDLGFMMYCSFGNAERLNPKPEYKEILMNSAKSLASRYNDTVKCIRSWDSASWNKAGEDDLVVIIDNMMNLELLFWATHYSGDSTYYKIAVNHADKTMVNHFRSDYSSYHEVIYDENTGEIKAQITNQGAADDSSWARGQAWGLYGYVVMYRETKDQKYLQQANAIAKYILYHPNMPKDMIPYWDFNAPNIPNALRDSSAAAIIASALIELKDYVDGEMKQEYEQKAETILKNLLTPEYIAEVGTNGGFVLKHGVGNMPNNSEVDVPLTYGDYYLIEAMMRYKNQKIN
ncbi:glycoside hydrolase family 88 protein [Confluentibacter sediminis]|uniref:glycoside hydrolase family 88 protein n=1 Tax=Confluentibacter sediminis TaxID=2219045 RepID=UPI000DADB380|nr:glycoside hydrolase family 88 protein [Confluentibacter sediminis]